MTHEWLLIALPIVFVFGWFAARLDVHHIRHSAARLPRAYLRGLTELLNGNEDKALDAFSDIEQKENLPPALQFTVGELSRRRGDYRRALKVHQQLKENEKLSETDRNRALWELANDCAAMGFVDAAEQHARLLVDTPGYRYKAFDFLLKNYQNRRHYAQALTLINNADSNAQQLQQNTAAHLYCQLADADKENRKSFLENALKINPSCARARLQLADAALAAKPPQTNDALAYYDLIAVDTPQYLWLTVDGLWRAHVIAATENQAHEKFGRWLDEFPSPMLLKAVIAVLEKKSETASEQAPINQMMRTWVEAFMIRYGGIEAAAYFIEQQSLQGNSEQWFAVKSALLNARAKSFVCNHCAYEVNHFNWQCPCCLHWESFQQHKS